MHTTHIDKVKAEIARLQDMEKRLRDVVADSDEETMALENADVDLGNAIRSFQDALDYAEGRKTPEPREVLPEESEAPDATFPNDDAEG